MVVPNVICFLAYWVVCWETAKHFYLKRLSISLMTKSLSLKTAIRKNLQYVDIRRTANLEFFLEIRRYFVEEYEPSRGKSAELCLATLCAFQIIVSVLIFICMLFEWNTFALFQIFMSAVNFFAIAAGLSNILLTSETLKRHISLIRKASLENAQRNQPFDLHLQLVDYLSSQDLTPTVLGVHVTTTSVSILKGYLVASLGTAITLYTYLQDM